MKKLSLFAASLLLCLSVFAQPPVLRNRYTTNLDSALVNGGNLTNLTAPIYDTLGNIRFGVTPALTRLFDSTGSIVFGANTNPTIGTFIASPDGTVGVRITNSGVVVIPNGIFTGNGSGLTNLVFLTVTRDFGAAGSPTDDTAAFQRAANAGLPIYVPAGTYSITNIFLTNNSRFFSDGATLLFATNGVGYMVTVTNSTNWCWNGFQMDGQGYGFTGSGNTKAWGINGSVAILHSSSVSRGCFYMSSLSKNSGPSRNRVINFSEYAFVFDGAGAAVQQPTNDNTRADFNAVEHCYGAVCWTNGAEYMHTAGWSIFDTGKAFYVGAGNNYVDNSLAINGGQAVEVDGNQGNPAHGQFTHCSFNHNNRSITAYNFNNGFEFNGCEILGASGGGGQQNINLTNVAGFVFENGTYFGNGGAGSMVIVVDGGAGDKSGQNVFRNNHVSGYPLVTLANGGLCDFENILNVGAGAAIIMTNTPAYLWSGNNTFSGLVKITNSINGSGTVFSNGIPIVISNNVVVAGISTNGHLSVMLSGTNLVSVHAVGTTNSGIMFDAANTNDTVIVSMGTNITRATSNLFTVSAPQTNTSVLGVASRLWVGSNTTPFLIIETNIAANSTNGNVAFTPLIQSSASTQTGMSVNANGANATGSVAGGYFGIYGFTQNINNGNVALKAVNLSTMIGDRLDNSRANFGMWGQSSSTVAGYNIGGHFEAANGTPSIGIDVRSVTTKNSAFNVGIASFALNGGTGNSNIAGYFALANEPIGFNAPSAAIVAENGTTTQPLFIGRSNGTTVVSIDGTGTANLAGIAGTIVAGNATAGNVGEYVSSAIAIGSAGGMSTATATNITSISLTAGDWDVFGNVNVSATGATITAWSAGISTTTGTLPTDGSECYSGVTGAGLTITDTVTLSLKRINVSSTTTVYLVGKSTFSLGTVAGFGYIGARRVR